MKWARHSRMRFLLAALVFALIIVTLVARLSRISRPGRPKVATWSNSQSPVPIAPPGPPAAGPAVNPTTPLSAVSPLSTITPSPSISVTPQPEFQFSQRQGDSPSNLIIPVAGVRPDQLRDTFSEARSEGRVHDAVDIPAPQGTPVLAAADGPIVKLFQSQRGGTTIYQASVDGKFIYYYAHLDRYADGLTEGHLAKQGETIAYVGDTGNAGAGNYHLHFSIAVTSNPKRYWEGVNINPYPLLKK